VFACICHAVSVDDVNAAIDRGAQSLDAIGDATRAGTSCRNCHQHLEDLVDERCGTCPLAKLAVA
jgi:bacterioferritin-associated ferredoxin